MSNIFDSLPMNDEQLERVSKMKAAAYALNELIEAGQQSRHTSIAKTSLEETVMWAIKAVSREEN